MRIAEIPITLHRDGRSRPPHLRSFRDGWRHLRFMLLFSPTYLFVLPGLLCIAVGLVPLIALGGGPRRVLGLNFDVHYMVRRQPAHRARLPDPHHRLVRQGVLARRAALRARPHAAGAAALLQPRARAGARRPSFLAGFAIDAAILVRWLASGRATLDAVRPALQASTLMIVGAQTSFSSFFLSMLAVPRRDG